MSMGEVVSALDHGTLVDNKLFSFRCNHCGEEVISYTRFKQHLGGIGGEVTPCVKVPENVKVQMSNSLRRTEMAHANNSLQSKNVAVIDVHVLEDEDENETNNLQSMNADVIDVLEDEDENATNKPDEPREVPQLFELSTSGERDSRSDDSAPEEASIDIRDHGTVVVKKKDRVRCNYCRKEVSCGYTRLMQHLGGIRGDVSPCSEVPETIKVQMEKCWRMKKKDRKLCRPGKRNSRSDDSPKKNGNCVKSSQPTLLRKRKHSPIIDYSGSEQEDEQLQALHYPKTSRKMKNDSSRQTQRCIGRFFFENGIDFSAANSPTFQKMINSLVGGGFPAFKVPRCDDLKGWILEEELKAMREHMEKVVCSWGSTGCSILLDGWTDEKGRNMINFVVDSPRGPIFMKSADISDSVGDVDAIVSLLSGVIEDVGVQNVVQIVTYTTAGSMEAVGEQMTKKYKSIFWTVCASHCIGLILEKIGMLGTGREVLSKAKAITKFIYSHETVLKLMRKHTRGFDLVSSSRIRSMMPFLILKRIESKKKNLLKMFTSSEWKNLNLASTADGRMVSDLVSGESSFWTEAETLLKASTPLMRALDLLNGEDIRPQLGYVYETIDQVKEKIKSNYTRRKAEYQPFWSLIDGIWDNQLHNPIHAAGLYLNAGLFYSSDFYADDEVEKGISRCIQRISKDKREHAMIESQFDKYKTATGAFGDGDDVRQIGELAPAKWWTLYGGECPELQRFAIRILSQTCTGALRYGLKRSLTEELHTKGRSCVEQERLVDLTFVQHNLRLQNLCASDTKYTDVFLEPINPMDEWIGGGVA